MYFYLLSYYGDPESENTVNEKRILVHLINLLSIRVSGIWG